MKRVPTTRPLRFNEASTYYPPIETHWDLMKRVPAILFNEAKYLLPAH